MQLTECYLLTADQLMDLNVLLLACLMVLHVAVACLDVDLRLHRAWSGQLQAWQEGQLQACAQVAMYEIGAPW